MYEESQINRTSVNFALGRGGGKRGIMRYLKYIGLAGVLLAVAAVSAPAQVVVGVGVGPAYVAGPPVCPYGYYSYYPYACAPYGYYGPEYFVDGVFIGAGPWFHGFYGPRFYGHSYYGHGYYGRGYYGHGYYGRGWDHGYRGWDHGYRGGGWHGGGYHGGGWHGRR